MKKRKYRNSITFLVSDDMCQNIDKYTEELGIGISDLMRKLVKEFFEKIDIKPIQDDQ